MGQDFFIREAAAAELEGIEALRMKFKSWGAPITLKEVGVDKKTLPKVAEDVLKNPEGHALDKREVLAVLESCYEG